MRAHLADLLSACATGDEPLWVSFVVFVGALAVSYLLLFVALPALVPGVLS